MLCTVPGKDNVTHGRKGSLDPLAEIRAIAPDLANPHHLGEVGDGVVNDVPGVSLVVDDEDLKRITRGKRGCRCVF